MTDSIILHGTADNHNTCGEDGKDHGAVMDGQSPGDHCKEISEFESKRLGTSDEMDVCADGEDDRGSSGTPSAGDAATASSTTTTDVLMNEEGSCSGQADGLSDPASQNPPNNPSSDDSQKDVDVNSKRGSCSSTSHNRDPSNWMSEKEKWFSIVLKPEQLLENKRIILEVHES
jgi:hypothetical protein